MKRSRMFAAAVVALATAVAMTGATNDAVADGADNSTKVIKVEKLSKKTKRTKVTQFKNQHGRVLASAATGLRDEVQVLLSADGQIRSIAVMPNEPSSQEATKALAESLTDEIVDERMGHFSEDELVPMPSYEAASGLPRPAPF